MKQHYNICESCDDKGWLEVTVEWDKTQVQLCQNCNIESTEELKQLAFQYASMMGYKLDEDGYIIN